jgi:hypothetical protein
MEQIDPRHLLIDVAKILKELRISYMVTGGIAVLVWGRPRFTADVDIVVEIDQNDLPFLEKALNQLSEYGYIDRQMMEEAIQTEGEFNFIDGGTGVKVDFWVLKNNAYEKLRLKRRIKKKILRRDVFFISPEDLILSKLQWYGESQSSKQMEDIESVFKISGKSLNKKYLKKQAKLLGLTKIINELIVRYEK